MSLTEAVYFRVCLNKTTNFIEIAETRVSYTIDKSIEIIKNFHNYIYNKKNNHIFWNKEEEPIPMFATIEDIDQINKPYEMGRTISTSGTFGICNFASFTGGYCNGLCGSDDCLHLHHKI